jgi:hypothetical protein
MRINTKSAANRCSIFSSLMNGISDINKLMFKDSSYHIRISLQIKAKELEVLNFSK